MNIDQIVIVKDNIKYKLHPSGLVEAEDLITGNKARVKIGKSFANGVNACHKILKGETRKPNNVEIIPF